MSPFERLLATDRALAPLVIRLAVAVVMFPHGAQKLFGWFNGGGFSGTRAFFIETLNIPAPLAYIAIFTEALAVVGLFIGLLTRPAALGILSIMVGALILFPPHGFFMNWSGNQGGEGLEFHLLMIAASLALIISGGGRASLDGWLARRMGARRSPSSAPGATAAP
ncbi:MAG TPA: DoxX family protein [Myxococcaceae bacterium]|jgi:putative oxidoreductase